MFLYKYPTKMCLAKQNKNKKRIKRWRCVQRDLVSEVDKYIASNIINGREHSVKYQKWTREQRQLSEMDESIAQKWTRAQRQVSEMDESTAPSIRSGRELSVKYSRWTSVWSQVFGIRQVYSVRHRRWTSAYYYSVKSRRCERVYSVRYWRWVSRQRRESEADKCMAPNIGNGHVYSVQHQRRTCVQRQV